MKHKKKVYKALKHIQKECSSNECCHTCEFYEKHGDTLCKIKSMCPEGWSLDKKTIFYNYESEDE